MTLRGKAPDAVDDHIAAGKAAEFVAIDTTSGPGSARRGEPTGRPAKNKALRGRREPGGQKVNRAPDPCPRGRSTPSAPPRSRAADPGTTSRSRTPASPGHRAPSASRMPSRWDRDEPRRSGLHSSATDLLLDDDSLAQLFCIWPMNSPPSSGSSASGNATKHHHGGAVKPRPPSNPTQPEPVASRGNS